LQDENKTQEKHEGIFIEASSDAGSTPAASTMPYLKSPNASWGFVVLDETPS
jgi:hypothetical protein